ncbi:ATP-binding cassette domain-containing protein [Candidatus Berkiella cookevillensis]|uniref:ATP-binding cassette domain-containing protein n=1 Tax=Candidatus Berkiella cookevillensis TaxID=437022 RepID=A0A0Q9YCL2_9GAMM|nr:ATP-binding cassette domain-containing protein [Candidatus Berkiella cookevillensis]MCS5708094.1 ATP-binding cassette domain-containing protein [Candidatus Berkiella cookevillensis]
MLSIHNASKHFGTHAVLKNINLQMNTNSIIGLAGPSGGGKSTLLRSIQQLEVLDSGDITCPEKTGFMFQDFQLFPHMTVLSNLSYAPTVGNKAIDPMLHQKRSLDLLEILGIKEKADYFPHQLSGGQKQRVALARCLMMQPKLLLCDEPTSGLDISSIRDVIGLLNNIHAMGVSMIIASHDLNFLTELADRILLLKDGLILADIEPKKLINPIKNLQSYY